LQPGGGGDFRVTVAGKVILDKKAEGGALDFAALNANPELCPEGKPQPFPKPAAAARVSKAILDAAAAAPAAAPSMKGGLPLAYLAGGALVVAVAAIALMRGR
jgi:hypothetical protein